MYTDMYNCKLTRSYRIESVLLDRQARASLCALGITRGSYISVAARTRYGVIAYARGRRIALEKRLCRRIVLEAQSLRAPMI